MIHRPGRKFTSVGQYMRSLPGPVRRRAEELRRIIRSAAPRAKEVISYNIPAFKANGVLVYFAGFEKHIGFYPTSRPIRVFASALSRFTTSKGAVQFSLSQEIPATLVKTIVKFRIEQDLKKGAKQLP